MNFDIILAIVFYLFLLGFYFLNKEKFEVKSNILFIYRTQLGISLMDKIAKKFKFILKPLSYISIFIGFSGMLFILFIILKGTFDLLFIPNSPPALAPVLPGVKVPGLPVLSFWHWVISIFIVAVIHEFSHGVFARLFSLKVQSSGFLFLGPILGAFVEPDEKQLEKASKREQLAILSAGPFSNIALAGILLILISFVSLPLQNNIIEFESLQVNKLVSGYPIEKSDIKTPFIIESINSEKIKNLSHFVSITEKIKPNQNLIIETDKGNIELTTLENPSNKSKGFIGLSDFSVNTKLKDNINKPLGNALLWLTKLLFWLFVVNLGIGLFNLLPLGPIDGGRMFLVLSSIIFKEKEKAEKFWSLISYALLIVILINLTPYFLKLFKFILNIFV